MVREGLGSTGFKTHPHKLQFFKWICPLQGQQAMFVTSDVTAFKTAKIRKKRIAQKKK